MAAIFGNSISLMSKSLQLLWKRQDVTLENIANVETPDYKARFVTFEGDFRRSLEAAERKDGGLTMEDAINDAHYTVHETKGFATKMNGNSVNADSEFIELTRTTFQYQNVLNALNNDISRLRSVIKG